MASLLDLELGNGPAQTDPETLRRLGKQAGLLGLSFMPGMGAMDYAGRFPAVDGGFEPSAVDNWRQGNYGTSLLQGLGAFGDSLYAVPLAGAVAGPTAGSLLKAPRAIQKAAKGPKPTVDNPQRVAYPGVYNRPDVIAREAEQMVAPESPLLKQLFGVTRDDLYEMSKRKGNMPGVIPGAAANPKGSAAAESVMTRRNERRLLDTLGELQSNAPELWKGMHGWYAMDPEYHRMVELMGPEKGAEMYRRLNVFGGIESPNLPVPIEFQRASAANWLAEQGRWDDWKKFGGLRDAERKSLAPPDMQALKGRVGHQRASASQEKFLKTGEHGMESPKAPPYIDASSVPELQFQTDLPVGDAHWSRGVGLADTRTSKDFDASVSTPEMQQLGPWWRDRIAGQAGLESVPAQGILWGGMAPYTGVKTQIGAPKLELHAIEIGKAAKRMGVSPEQARDMILMGRAHAGVIDPKLAAILGGAAGGGLLADQLMGD
jgi:hypothetical protein